MSVVHSFGFETPKTHQYNYESPPLRNKLIQLLSALFLFSTLLPSAGSSRCTRSSVSRSLLLSTCWLQNLERAHESIINRHHRPSIVKLSTVVGRREHRHKFSPREKLIPVFHNLVSTDYKIKIMTTKELTHNIATECERHTAVILIPTSNRWVRIGPKNVAKKTSVRNITWPCNIRNLFHLAELRTQTTMHTDDFVINNGSTGEAVKSIAESLPQLHTETTTTLIIETVDPVDPGTLMVTSEDEEIFRVLDLISK
mmetsp:Transcript_15416/g.25393  ORF Transcript_15416/g.25393 Transcript_15416/m.25393 type:complete len:256 (-) Transcript_15416:491-1258(-)